MFSPADATANALAKLPTGFAWTHAADSNWGRLFGPAGAEQATFETAAEAQLDEATPSTAAALLPDYERVLGPDPCMGPVPGTLQERRESAHSRWTERGGASRQHYIDLAAKLGYAITIEEFFPSRVGRLRMGQRLAGTGVSHTWRVHAPPPVPVRFRTGSGQMGQRLTSAGIPLLECNLRRRAPAHTVMIMAYDNPVPVTDDRGVPVTDDKGVVVTA